MIIETENLVAGGISDLERCLDSLERQTLHPSAADDVSIIDGGRIPQEVIDAATQRWPWLKVHQVGHDVSYYGSKMLGAARVTSDVVVLADSDMEYEPDWLHRMLEPFQDNDHQLMLVCGDTLMHPNSPLNVALLMAWMLPALPPATKLVPAFSYRANNFATQPCLFREYPIPTHLPLYRAPIRYQAEALRAAGIPMFRQPLARGYHAPPESFREWFWRMMVLGHDAVRGIGVIQADGTIEFNCKAPVRWKNFTRLLWRCPLQNMRRGWTLIRHKRISVGQALVAAPITIACSLLEIIGGLLTCLESDLVLNRILAFEKRAGVDWSDAALTLGKPPKQASGKPTDRSIVGNGTNERLTSSSLTG